MTLPRLPLPDERPLTLLFEDRTVRLYIEVLIALLCVPVGVITLSLLRGDSYAPDGATIMGTLIALAPIVIIATLRTPAVYLLTTHRIAQIQDDRFVWSLRYDQIRRIRRVGATLHLRGAGRNTYSVANLRHTYWLETYLWDRTST